MAINNSRVELIQNPMLTITSQLFSLDKLLIGLIGFLAMLPFGQVFQIELGFITLNLFELIYLAMILVLGLKIISSLDRLYYPGVFFMFSLLVLIYGTIFPFTHNIAVAEAWRQLRNYLPFIIALMILATGIKFEIKRYLNTLVLASIVSASSAIVIHYLFPDFLRASFATMENVADVSEWGRLYWINSVLTFFVMLTFFEEHIQLNRLLLFFAFIATLSTTFSTLSRTMILGVLIFLLYAGLCSRNVRLFGKRFLYIIIVISSLLLIIYFSIHADKRLSSLTDARFFGRGNPSSVYTEDLELNRFLLYAQYYQIIRDNIIFGQGLGLPMAVSATNNPVPVADISLVAFIIPFGLFGLAILVMFLRRLFSIINNAKLSITVSTKKNIRIILLMFIGISFNVDVFSRNNFIIFFSTLLMIVDYNERLAFHKITNAAEHR